LENKSYHRVLIGVGSNVGDRVETCCAAIEKLKRHPDIMEVKASPFFESDPVGVTSQPPFINLVIKMVTSQTPKELLRILKDLENELGRVYRYRWGPRELDLDILLYDDAVISTETLKIPHPEMHKRAFVLVPACEICPDWEHPLLKKSLKQLLSAIPGEGVSLYKGPVPCD
jgi:2-amino-4-hydroxy-6-hydroxymethyldihydropteridine diphosphokinase